ncbi:F-box domain protein [Pandoravirus inopinatum]|uniref:F-box domain protein n=1 Tax=Pandoravirus inopinatum TaxID=1605721 RepID=A0A0B5JEU0_9VIRU|nr:F-box domain protein [Pandoravirus inopinatum]AJF98312.1 F-box domain protein [Pandoravirus inopinatum]
MPCEVLMHILSGLPGPSLAAAGATCRLIYGVASCEDLWRSAYRRDFGCDLPPATHVDFAAHGKDVRWLYALAAVPAGRVWRDPTTRHLCTRLVSADGKIVTSGECCLVTDPATGDARLRLDGYGAHASADGIICEGTWREGVFTGPGRVYRPPGTNGFEYVDITRCQNFDDRLRAQGHGSEYLDDHFYEGSFVDDNRDGFGVYKWPGDSMSWAEWSGGRRNGRVLHVGAGADCHTFSGQIKQSCTDKCDFVTKRGVKRTRSGGLEEALWHGDTHVWKIVRPSPERHGGKAMSMRDASTALSTDGSIMRSRSTAYRIDTPSGDVVIGGDCGLFFIGVSDACDDRRLAGRRFFPTLDDPQAWHTIAAAPADTDRGPYLVPSDPTSPMGRSFALYLEQSDCALDHSDAIRAAIQSQTASVDGCMETVAAGDATLGECVRVPFGRLALAAGGLDGTPMIRCFLTGTMVAATDCRVLSSGRAYEAKALDAWRTHAGWRSTDPETGDDLALPDMVLPCRAWMVRDCEPADLAWAVTQAHHDSKYDPSTMQDLIRFNATVLTRRTVATHQTTCDGLRPLFAAPVDVARDENGPLVRGFDGVAMTCIELRHPDWDPRGPWRLGTPDCVLPEDITVGDHERPDAAPLDHLESHGIARVALESPSFLGAHLEGVFFFGHTLRGASFAGARLVGCAFIGCRFERCVFAGALLVRCHFDECTRGDGTAVDTDAALAVIQKVGIL